MSLFWSKVETGRPSRWHTPHPAATNDPTPVLEGADKLSAQMGLRSVTAASSMRSVVVFSYRGPGGGSSDSDSEGEEDRANELPHPHFRSKAANAFASGARAVERSGMRPADHRPALGNITIAVGSDTLLSPHSPSSASPTAAAEAVVAEVIAASYAAARHVSQMSGGVGAFGEYPLVASAPSLSGANNNGALGGFIRNVPSGAMAASTEAPIDPRSPAAVAAASQRRVLVTARTAAVRRLAIERPLGATGLLSRLLYEGHMRALACGGGSLLSSSSSSEDLTDGFAVRSLCGPLLATATAFDAIRGGGAEAPRPSHVASLFTQFVLDAVTATLSAPPQTAATARATPISPFLLSLFEGSSGGGSGSGRGVGGGSSINSNRSLWEAAAAAVRTALFDQLSGCRKSLLTRALADTVAEDDGLSASDACSQSSSSSSSSPAASPPHHRTDSRRSGEEDVHAKQCSNASVFVSQHDAAISSNSVPIHPRLFAAAAVPLYPGAPLLLPAECRRVDAAGRSLPKPTKLLSDGPSRERADVRYAPCYYAASLNEDRCNDMAWGAVVASRLLSNAPVSSSSSSSHASVPDVEGYGLMLEGLRGRLAAILPTLGPSAAAALLEQQQHHSPATIAVPGQTSATMVLHYWRLLLKAIFSGWGDLHGPTANNGNDQLAARLAREWQAMEQRRSGGASSSSDSDSDSGSEMDEAALAADVTNGTNDAASNNNSTRARGATSLASDALLAVLCGGCRFVAVHTFTASAAASSSSSSSSSSAVELHGGLSAVSGRSFYFAQLSHYDRLLQAVLAKNMAASRLTLAAAAATASSSSSSDVAARQSVLAAGGSAAPSLATIDDVLADALADLAALGSLEGSASPSPFSSSSVASSAPLASPLSAYVVRGLSTDHPSLPKMDFVIVGLGGDSLSSHRPLSTSTVVVMGFPAAVSGGAPSAASAALEGIVRAMAMGPTGPSRQQGVGLSEWGPHATAPAFDCSDSSSDDDLTIEEIRAGRSAVGGAPLFSRQADKALRKRRGVTAASQLVAYTAGGNRGAKGSGGCCCGPTDDPEPFAGFAYGNEPAVDGYWRATAHGDFCASSTSTQQEGQQPATFGPVEAEDAARRLAFRRHGIVKRRRGNAHTIADAVAAAKQRERLRAANAANGTLAAHCGVGAPEAAPSRGRFLVDPSLHWSPLTVAGPRPTAVSGRAAAGGCAGLRQKAKVYAQLLTQEGRAAAGGSSDAALLRDQRRLAGQWEAPAHRAALRTAILHEQSAAAAELTALRTRIDRIERSGELHRMGSGGVGGLRRVAAVGASSSARHGSSSHHNQLVVPVFGQDEGLARLYDKLRRRERFLSLLVLAAPFRPREGNQQQQHLQQLPATSHAFSSASSAVSLGELLAEAFRYSRKCARAAELHYCGIAEAFGSSSAAGESSARLSLVTGALTDGGGSLSAYEASVGPLVAALVGDGRDGVVHRGGAPPRHGGSAVALCERALVGVGGGPSAAARYHHLHNYSASTPSVLLSHPRGRQQQQQAIVSTSVEFSLPLPPSTSSSSTSSHGAQHYPHRCTPLSRAMGEAGRVAHSSTSVGSSGEAPNNGPGNGHSDDDGTRDAESIGVFSLSVPAATSAGTRKECGAVRICSEQLALSVVAQLVADC